MNNDTLLKFLASYGGIEAPQDPIEAATDGQLKSLTTFLATQLATVGSIVDIGAGRGALLSRLVGVDAFMTSQCEYIAIDEERYHREILGIAVGARVHKRVSAITLDEFYTTWPQLPTGGTIITIRNVFHELDIASTAQLLEHLAEHTPIGATVVVQDLAVFPVAEKGNACWQPLGLRELFESFGFTCAHVEEPTKSGNLWFNLVATRTQSASGVQHEVLSAVLRARTKQWRSWADNGALTRIELERDARVAKIDFDLQFAALTLQLVAAGAPGVAPLTRKQEQLAAMETFERSLAGVRLDAAYDSSDIPPVRHFKDRANSQDKLQEFLAGTHTIAAITGPALMGKSALVQHVLSSFAHRRKMIHVDALSSWSTWNLLESVFSACGVRVPQEIVGRLQHIDLSTIVDPVSAFVRNVAPRSILVIDHVERLIGPTSRIDPELAQVLGLWATTADAKMILTSRRPVPDLTVPGVTIERDHPPVGRFPHGPHVANILSTFVPRTDFPEPFVDAIDRHPLMAELAGRILQNEGEAALDDVTLRVALRDRLRNKLMERVSNDLARPALVALMHTRRAVPRAAANDVAGSASVTEALETGLGYEFTTTAGLSLISCIRGFRYDHAEDDDELELPDRMAQLHKKWAGALLHYFKNDDDDPQWLREAYYHTAVSGSREALESFGQMYRSEFQDAGEYWFRKGKDFPNALWAFERVAALSTEQDPLITMRIASCLIRTDQPERGLEMFKALFEAYPDWIGVRSSCVDGLLYLQKYSEALVLLKEFADYTKLTEDKDGWQLGQYGRAYAGLHDYNAAAEAFSRQLALDNAPVVVRALARAYHRLGRRSDAGRVLERGHRDHPDSLSILASLASWLEANGDVDRALSLLEPIIETEAENAWVAFAYVQALIAAGRSKDARRYVDRYGAGLTPRFMRLSVEAQVLKAEGRYADALRLLDPSSEDQYDTEHRVGQRAEVYLAWADQSNEVDVAKRGLSELPVGSNNLLINVSILKLCVIADDSSRFSATLASCKALNPNSDDVQRLEQQAKLRWSAFN